MKAIININGIVGEIPDANGNIMTPNVTFVKVAQQVEALNGVTELDVFINSVGGFVEEGDEIYDYLVSLKSKGIKINTHAEEVCASIATKIFLAGDERFINDFTEFMIHNPFGAPPEGDADLIEKYYKALRATENDMINFYSQRTGTSKEAIKPLMKKETFLTPVQAVEFGFATELLERVEIQAFAYSNKLNINLNTSKQMAKENLDKKGVNAKIDELLAAVKNIGKSTKAKGLKIVLDANAGEIEFPELNPDDTPAVGDKTTAKDGEYVMPSGETYVIADGSLTEIKPVEEEEEIDESEELAKAKVRIAELEGQVSNATALQAENDQLKSEAKESVKAIKSLKKGLKAVQQAIGSDFSHDGKQKNHKKGGEQKSRSLMKTKSED